MANYSLHATSAGFPCVGRVMSMREGKEHKSAHSAEPVTSASRVWRLSILPIALSRFIIYTVVEIIR